MILPALLVLLKTLGPLPALAMSEFKGYFAINRTLQERLVQSPNTFQLGVYLDESYNPFGNSLLDLLGTYDRGSLDSAFRNGKPNVVNVLLWHVVFSGLSRDLAALCLAGAPPNPRIGSLAPSFESALKTVCAWPQASAQSDEALLAFWLGLMSFDAPIEEFEAWRDFFRSAPYVNAPAQEAVAALVLAAFSNPYFLLRR